MKHFVRDAFAVIFISVLLAECTLAFLDYFGFFVERFEPIEVYQNRTSGAEYQLFLERGYDAELGWNPQPNSVRENRNCLGRTFRITWLQDGSRLTTTNNEAKDTKSVRDVYVFGDSYTLGDEANDAESYPSKLANASGLNVHNFGVGGFGPYQAFLKMKRTRQTAPDDSIFILGIMSENPRRLVNSFRPASNFKTGGSYGFKPYAKDKQFVPNPNYPPLEFDGFLDLAETAFREDYWANAKNEFPYSINFFRYVRDAYIRRRYFDSDEYIAEQMRFFLEAYFQYAEDESIEAYILLVPRDGQQRDTFHNWKALNLEQWRERLIHVRSDQIDWKNYNLRPGCHPSSYGYEVIAEAVLQFFEEKWQVKFER